MWKGQWGDKLVVWDWQIHTAAAAAAKSLQSCPTLCDPIERLPCPWQKYWSGLPFPSPMHERVKVKSLSRVWPSATPWTATYQAPLSMGFSRQDYRSGVPLPFPEINPTWLQCVILFIYYWIYLQIFVEDFLSKLKRQITVFWCLWFWW